MFLSPVPNLFLRAYYTRTTHLPVLHRYRFRSEILIKRFLSKVLAEPGLFPAAEGRRNVRLIVCIYVNGSRLQTVGDFQRLVDVFCEDARGEAVFRGVCPFQHLPRRNGSEQVETGRTFGKAQTQVPNVRPQKTE